jgi:hypothetical protein
MLQVGSGTQNIPDLGSSKPTDVSYDFTSDKFGSEAYVAYQFFDTENIRLSAKSFSYLGSKKILNIGLGYEYQPRASALLNQNRDTVFNNTLSYAIDCYADLPLKSGAVFSAYGAFYNYDYGKNWLKTGGSGNYFLGGNTPQGSGTAEYTCGTGKAFYAHAAYLFARNLTKENHRLQVYLYTYFKNFEALKQASWQPGCGLNYYILGHNAKIGLQYYLRNVYGDDLKISDRKHNLMMMFQISL